MNLKHAPLGALASFFFMHEASAVAIAWNTTTIGTQTVFAGTVQETVVDFRDLGRTTTLIEGGSVEEFLLEFRFVSIGDWDGDNPPAVETINVETEFSVGTQSVTLLQMFTVRQIEDGMFMWELSASQTETISLGPRGLLDISIEGRSRTYGPVGAPGAGFRGTLTLRPIPLPAALPLFVGGLVSLGFLRQSRSDELRRTKRRLMDCVCRRQWS